MSGRCDWSTVALACVAIAVPEPSRAQCPGNALVTLEDGAIVNVEWPERSTGELRGRAIANATLLTEYQVALRPDESTASAATSARALDDKPRAEQLQVAPARCSGPIGCRARSSRSCCAPSRSAGRTRLTELTSWLTVELEAHAK
ncbi:MAG TPA: hypothetical protein VIX73_07845 [Kofleriaceae bacterium]